MGAGPKNRPGSFGHDVLDTRRDVDTVEEIVVTIVEEGTGGGGGFPPIAAVGDWNPQAAVAGCSYIWDCSCSGGKQLNLPIDPEDGDEVGFGGTCGGFGPGPLIASSCHRIQTPGCGSPIFATTMLQPGAYILRFSEARDRWETVQGSEGNLS